MAGSPIELVKKSLHFVVDNLKNDDQFSIVTFGSKAEVMLTLTKMSPAGTYVITNCFLPSSASLPLLPPPYY